MQSEVHHQPCIGHVDESNTIVNDPSECALPVVRGVGMDYIHANIDGAAVMGHHKRAQSSASSAQATSISGHRPGTVPKYLRHRQKEWDEEATRIRKEQENSDIPKDHKVLTESDRHETLRRLNDRLAMQQQKVRKRFKEFILRNIKDSIQEQEYLDVGFIGQEGSLKISAHRFVLAGLSPMLRKVFLSSGDEEETCVIFPDIPHMTIAQFLSLAYGILKPEVIEPDDRKSILDLCQILEMDTTTILSEPTIATVNITGEFGDDFVPSAVVKEESEEMDEDPGEEEDEEEQEEDENDDEEENGKTADPKDMEVEEVNETRFKCSVCGTTFLEEHQLKAHEPSHQKPPDVIPHSEMPPRLQPQQTTSASKATLSHPTSKYPSQSQAIALPPSDTITEPFPSTHTSVVAVKSRVLLRESKLDGQLNKANDKKKQKRNQLSNSTLDCHICSKSFARKDSLNDHLKRHLGTKYTCGFCPKVFKTANDLYKHKQRLHSKEAGVKSAYPVKCDICGRKFTDMGKAYQDHMNLHTGEKGHMYECTICKERFRTQVALSDHKYSHMEGGTHKCNICKKVFRRIQNIRQHLNTVHDVKTDDEYRANIEKLFLSGVEKMAFESQVNKDNASSSEVQRQVP
eukprot:TCALIF_11058-PA protein Name:"Similar to ZNF584 Zinc finger protein 584 (Homo sapiens)" AED:0.16 eAED:0.18 QI:0/0/0/1/1/1/2/0/629